MEQVNQGTGMSGAELLKRYKNPEKEEPEPRYFVDTTWFSMIIGSVICLSALVIGLDVDYSPVTPDISKKMIWFVLDLTFTFVFVLEMLLKQYFYRWEYFESHANKFDFSLVLLAVFDNCLTVSSVDVGIGKFRMLRMFRLLRLVRMIRLLSMFQQLWQVVSGLLRNLRTIFWVSILLLMVVYVAAIIATLAVGRNEEYDNYRIISGGWDHHKYFGTLPRSMLTMFQIVTLENWCNAVARHVITTRPSMAAFFIVFIFITSFGILNLVVGIIVESTISLSRRDSVKLKEKKELEQLRSLNVLRQVFVRADKDGSGTIDAEEFETLLLQGKVQNQFLALGIPLHEASELFDILDLDGSGLLSIDEFFAGCFKLSGSAKSKDLLSVQAAIESLWRRMTTLEASLTTEEKLVEHMDVVTSRMVRNYSDMLLDTSGPGKEQFKKQMPGTYLPQFPGFL